MHRRVLGLVAVAIAMGVSVGLVLGLGHTAAGVALAVIVLLVGLPALAWIGTWRILGPVRRLAWVAEEIGRGRLDARVELDESDDEVGPVASALHGVADRLSRQLEHQRALMGAVSHELRSPLARARVLVEMSREGSAPADLADRLEEEIAVMDGIVGDLLASARIDFDAIQRAPLDLAQVVARAVLEAGISEDVVHAAVPVPSVQGDRALLARALSVMIDNAQLHGGGVVALRVEHGDSAVYVEILDSGRGFAAGDESKAFVPFWRAGGESAPRGEGLGLALVRRIAEAHGGSATAGNRVQGGAWVRLQLPVAREG